MEEGVRKKEDGGTAATCSHLSPKFREKGEFDYLPPSTLWERAVVGLNKGEEKKKRLSFSRWPSGEQEY